MTNTHTDTHDIAHGAQTRPELSYVSSIHGAHIQIAFESMAAATEMTGGLLSLARDIAEDVAAGDAHQSLDTRMTGIMAVYDTLAAAIEGLADCAQGDKSPSIM